MTADKLAPVHPGEVLLEEFLKPLVLSQNRLALDIGVPPRRINEIVLGKRRISADTALRLGRYSTPRRSSGWGFSRTATLTLR
jgi:addiction module HigA family antidote